MPATLRPMDPKTSHGMLLAPGASDGRAVRFPSLDDHIVKPETREEMLRGRRVMAMPALPPHADRQCEIDYVVRGNVRAGYISSSELLTRPTTGSDFATDTCVRKGGNDPSTGTRYLEEVAFEVVNEQSHRSIREKAEDLTQRGVRRVFAIFVKRGRVCEWEPGGWRQLSLNGVIEDRCFSRPIRVKALLDAAEADDAVAWALVEKGNPVIEKVKAEVKAEGEAKGEAKGKAEGILAVLRVRGLEVPEYVLARILGCQDVALLDQWIAAAVTAKSAADVVAGAKS